ncbi:MAG: Lpp/OprI family alanine-zipper lipoprotein [Methylococcaceae bacterium]|nr:Lpp/OprI family alanine-zipper lipoprotein [Methylococcaceae bacterium]MCI0733657.1 Lpp/OprI family alanine-zipper lipoprotein [Methylococcaceae bacterium]
MVKIVSKVAILVLAAGLAGGCATQGDLDAVRADLSRTDKKADDAAAAAASAMAAAERAEEKAGAAESAAMRAASAAEEANSKLDRMFKHSMMK